MRRSSADTNYTFGNNTVVVADGGNQSSPGTGDRPNEDIERPEGLLHDQGPLRQSRTDLPGLGTFQGNGKQKDLIMKWT